MDGHDFDTLLRSLVESRRAILGGALSLAAGMVGAATAVGKKKRKRKKRKPRATPNEFGCLEVDDPCTSAEQCCSGICEGKKGKRTCRGHGLGTCKPQPGFCLDPNSLLVPCNNEINCVCLNTTANSLFCAGLGPSKCADCQRDADCTMLGFPAGSACVPVGEGACTGACASGMMCAVPCGTPLPEPTD